MSDAAVATTADKPRRLEVRGKLRQACDAMVWEGLTYDEAAKQFNFSVRSMRDALSRPHVLAYIRAEREVLRASLAPRNIHRLREIRDAADNMPAVNAIKVLEQLGDTDTRGGSSTSPQSAGVTIHIHAAPQAGPQPANVRLTEAKPLITLDRDSLHENVASNE